MLVIGNVAAADLIREQPFRSQFKRSMDRIAAALVRVPYLAEAVVPVGDGEAAAAVVVDEGAGVDLVQAVELIGAVGAAGPAG